MLIKRRVVAGDDRGVIRGCCCVFAVEQQSRSLFKIETNAQGKKKTRAEAKGRRISPSEGGRKKRKKIAAEHCRCISSGGSGDGGERPFPFAPLRRRQTLALHSEHAFQKIIVKRRSSKLQNKNIFFLFMFFFLQENGYDCISHIKNLLPFLFSSKFKRIFGVTE